ncbi:hypothetical protein BV898_17034 [Hypsibius exemplaris]|uniref:Uncharacterized protein n=1 Tax=Hypsibius exemplaris TaxID=2072580 RepID=A0A9X6NH00_HYPEX|nr:hypothetical protein BV898_17034 [Hypsibius exemplaris]
MEHHHHHPSLASTSQLDAPSFDPSEIGPISPTTTVESGYRTRPGSFSASATSSTFFPESDDCLALHLDMELDDEVFVGGLDLDATAAVNGDAVVAEEKAGKEGGRIPFARSRAFSFPFTVADLRFPAAVTLRRHFFTTTADQSSRTVESRCGGGNGASDDGDYGDDDEMDIDGVDGFLASSPFSSNCSSRMRDEEKALLDSDAEGEDDAIRRPVYRGWDVPVDPFVDLPDLVMSSGLQQRYQSGTVESLTETECRIACRLAKIGDELDVKFFNSSDTTDGNQLLNIFNRGTITRMWTYFTSIKACAGSPRVSARQRSYSTAG